MLSTTMCWTSVASLSSPGARWYSSSERCGQASPLATSGSALKGARWPRSSTRTMRRPGGTDWLTPTLSTYPLASNLEKKKRGMMIACCDNCQRVAANGCGASVSCEALELLRDETDFAPHGEVQSSHLTARV